MIITQTYTAFFGVPNDGSSYSRTVNIVRNAVCRPLDLLLPIVLIILGVLGHQNILAISQGASWATISIGATLGLSQFLLYVTQKLPFISSRPGYLGAMQFNKEHLTLCPENLFAPDR